MTCKFDVVTPVLTMEERGNPNVQGTNGDRGLTLGVVV